MATARCAQDTARPRGKPRPGDEARRRDAGVAGHRHDRAAPAIEEEFVVATAAESEVAPRGQQPPDAPPRSTRSRRRGLRAGKRQHGNRNTARQRTLCANRGAAYGSSDKTPTRRTPVEPMPPTAGRTGVRAETHPVADTLGYRARREPMGARAGRVRGCALSLAARSSRSTSPTPKRPPGRHGCGLQPRHARTRPRRSSAPTPKQRESAADRNRLTYDGRECPAQVGIPRTATTGRRQRSTWAGCFGVGGSVVRRLDGCGPAGQTRRGRGDHRHDDHGHPDRRSGAGRRDGPPCVVHACLLDSRSDHGVPDGGGQRRPGRGQRPERLVVDAVVVGGEAPCRTSSMPHVLRPAAHLSCGSCGRRSSAAH